MITVRKVIFIRTLSLKYFNYRDYNADFACCLHDKHHSFTEQKMSGILSYHLIPLTPLLIASWEVACAACCHVILVFAIMHLCNFDFSLFLAVPFFILGLVLISQRVLAM